MLTVLVDYFAVSHSRHCQNPTLELYRRASNKIGVSSRAVQSVEGKNTCSSFIRPNTTEAMMSSSDAYMLVRLMSCPGDGDAIK